jgi:hypothetical protein
VDTSTVECIARAPDSKLNRLSGVAYGPCGLNVCLADHARDVGREGSHSGFVSVAPSVAAIDHHDGI